MKENTTLQLTPNRCPKSTPRVNKFFIKHNLPREKELWEEKSINLFWMKLI